MAQELTDANEKLFEENDQETASTRILICLLIQDATRTTLDTEVNNLNEALSDETNSDPKSKPSNLCVWNHIK